MIFMHCQSLDVSDSEIVTRTCTEPFSVILVSERESEIEHE